MPSEYQPKKPIDKLMERGKKCTDIAHFNWGKMPKTNADRIRAMTDEELAWELCRIQRMPFYKDDNDIDEYEVDCSAKWLKEEYKE